MFEILMQFCCQAAWFPETFHYPLNNSFLFLSLSPQSQNSIDFFLLLAVCNTVIVAKQPHRDTMNASGIVCPPSSSSSARIDMGTMGTGASPNLPSATSTTTTTSIRFVARWL